MEERPNFSQLEPHRSPYSRFRLPTQSFNDSFNGLMTPRTVRSFRPIITPTYPTIRYRMPSYPLKQLHAQGRSLASERASFRLSATCTCIWITYDRIFRMVYLGLIIFFVCWHFVPQCLFSTVHAWPAFEKDAIVTLLCAIAAVVGVEAGR